MSLVGLSNNDLCSLTTVEVIHQNVGNTSSLRLQLSALSCDECGAIPWDELQVQIEDNQIQPPSEMQCKRPNVMLVQRAPVSQKFVQKTKPFPKFLFSLSRCGVYAQFGVMESRELSDKRVAYINHYPQQIRTC